MTTNQLLNKPWLCSTNLIEKEMRDLLLTYLDSLKVFKIAPIMWKLHYDPLFESGTHEQYIMLYEWRPGYLRIDGCSSIPERCSWGHYPRFTFKEIVKAVEKVRKQNEKL